MEQTAVSAVTTGAQLTSARERAGLTLIQAAERLHLDVVTLQAMEAGQFQTLGATVFARGHLRRYAELLGVPLNDVDAAYAASLTQAPAVDLRRGAATSLASGRPARPALGSRSALFAALAAVLAALVWWAMRMPRAAHHVQAAPSTAVSVAANRNDAAAGGNGADGADDDDPTTLLPPPGAFAPSAASYGAATPAKSAASPAESGSVHAPSDAAAKTSGASARTDSGKVRLGLKFNQDSWAEIYDANGSRLYYDLGAAGSERRLAGLAPLHILLGNPEGVRLELDGQVVPLQSATATNTPVRFSLDGGGRIIEIRSAESVAAAPALQP